MIALYNNTHYKEDTGENAQYALHQIRCNAIWNK